PDSWRKKAAAQFRHETEGPIVVYSSKEPFLSWDSLRRLSLSRSVVAYHLKTGKTREMVPETKIAWYALSDDGSFLILAKDSTSKTDYDVIGGSENQIQWIPLKGGDKTTIIKSTKGLTLQWSRDYKHYAYVKDGGIFVGSVFGKEPKQVTGKKAGTDEKNAADSARIDTAKYTLVRLSPKGEKMVVSNKEGLWLMQIASGEKELMVKMPEEDKETPRYQVYDWSPTGDTVYLNYSARTKWDRGISRYDRNSKKLEELRRDSLLYNNFRISRDGSTVLFNSSPGNRPPSLYLSDVTFKNTRLVYDASSQLKNKQLSKTQLISYLDADGNKMYGVLYYPVNYVQGKKYPTVFNIYEDYFDDNFGGTINILTSNGYAVMQPSVTLETGFPGEAWLKGVTAAANKLIEMGIADADRLGVQGTSYGGYATNLLVTQTNRFKAAVNISGKVNMISFYTGSPRLGVRNIHAPEKSQDRLGATLWQQPQKYIQHSAIMFADRIKTPLLLISGGQDHNVPAEQSREMFYALRRLGKEVQWVNYINGGHGMPTTTVEEMKDYHQRILDWYNTYLKSDPKKRPEEGKSMTAVQ
ncbi:MAG TPA: prolyl oligopeptidase family serine peptidase, partial [Flavisolibacter sp.]|nr:prolyl oligopeptidase family serine peptidase [Flavisolibacter sp.]